MASDKILQTRVSLKYDTYANWIAKDPVLLAGELAIAVVPADTGAVKQEPAVLIKVGDGTKKFSELDFISGKAANVYSWALAATKPSYTAAEIGGLSDYISGEIQDTDTQYKIAADVDNPRKLILYSKAKDAADFSATAFSFTVPDETVYTLVEGATNGTVAFNGKDVKVHGLGTAAYLSEEQVDAKVDAKDAAIAAAKKAGDDAQAAVDALDEKVGSVAEGKTVVGLVGEAKAAADAAQIDVDTVSAKVETLIGSDAGKSARAIANEELAAQLIPENASEALNTLKEIADWIQAHPGEASEMNTKIAANETAIASLQADSHTHANKTVLDGISGTKVSNWDAAFADKHAHANKTVLDGISAAKVEAWDGAVAKQHEHANKTVLDGISAEKVAAWDAAEQNAKDYADGVVAGLDSSATATAAADDKYYVLTGVSQADGKISKASEVQLEKIAKTGNVADLIQTAGNYITFNCGSATINI